MTDTPRFTITVFRECDGDTMPSRWYIESEPMTMEAARALRATLPRALQMKTQRRSDHAVLYHWGQLGINERRGANEQGMKRLLRQVNYFCPDIKPFTEAFYGRVPASYSSLAEALHDVAVQVEQARRIAQVEQTK